MVVVTNGLRGTVMNLHYRPIKLYLGETIGVPHLVLERTSGMRALLPHLDWLVAVEHSATEDAVVAVALVAVVPAPSRTGPAIVLGVWPVRAARTRIGGIC